MSFRSLWSSTPSFYFREYRQEMPSTQSLFVIERAGINHGTVPWNFHDPGANFHRLYYNLDQGSSVFVEGRLISLTAETVFFLPAGVPFEARTINPNRHCFIEFTQTPFSRPLTAVRELPARISYAKIFQDMHQAVASENESATLCLALAILHLAAVDLEMRCQMLPEELSAILTLIPKNKFRDTSKSLANRMGYGVHRFRRWFQSHLNITAADYIRQAQVAEAAKLLRSTEISIEQIAEECGFPNRFYLSRVFGQERGMGPGEYRKKAMSATPGSKGASTAGGEFVPHGDARARWLSPDLTPHLNRRWQGPECWFGDLPLKFHGGKRNIFGVPLKLPEFKQPNQFVLLRSRRIPRSMGRALPAEIALDIGKKAAAVYILHACAWLREPAVHLADYIFHYTDGKKAIAPIWAFTDQSRVEATSKVAGVLGDWFAARPLLRNALNASFVVSGAARDHEAVLYLFRWTNPHPRVTLQKVTFRSIETSKIPLAIMGVSVLLSDKTVASKKRSTTTTRKK